MTYTLTVNAGTSSIVMPNGVRYFAGSAFTLTDEQYGLLEAGAKSRLTAGAGGTATGYLGGTVSHQVTIAAGLKNVVLPDGLRYRAGDVTVLSDADYGLIPHGALAALFSADTTTLT
jgi:hypothetical protein